MHVKLKSQIMVALFSLILYSTAAKFGDESGFRLRDLPPAETAVANNAVAAGCYIDNVGGINYTYVGGNIFGDKHIVNHTATAAECCALCSQYASKGCVFFSWNPVGCYGHPSGCCRLKSEAAWAGRSPGPTDYISGSTKPLPQLAPSPASSVTVTTLAGGGGTACTGHAGYKDGLASEALFNLPARAQAVAMPHGGERLFVLDNHNGCVRSFPLGLDPADTFVRSETGCGPNSTLAYLGPDALYPNGTSRKWRWVDGPLDFWVSSDTLTIWVMDTYNNQVKVATKADVHAAYYGPWKTLAGSGALGTADGDAAAASFYQAHGLAVAESTGFAYVSDTFSSCIRSVSLRTGRVRTIAGQCGQGGHRDTSNSTSTSTPAFTAFDARFNHVHKVTIDPRNESLLYVSDVEYVIHTFLQSYL